MAAGTREDPADLMARVGRHWGWVLAFGVITVLIGIAALVWPGRTLVVVAVLFGIQLIVMGIFRFVGAFASDDRTGGTRVLLALLGVLSLIIGLYALRHILITLLALALLLGIFWVVSGAVELFTALSHREMRSRGWTAVMGIFSIVAGIVVLGYPGSRCWRSRSCSACGSWSSALCRSPSRSGSGHSARPEQNRVRQ